MLKDIKKWVAQGETSAKNFALKHRPTYSHIPGKEIQRLIDEEIKKGVRG